MEGPWKAVQTNRWGVLAQCPVPVQTLLSQQALYPTFEMGSAKRLNPGKSIRQLLRAGLGKSVCN